MAIAVADPQKNVVSLNAWPYRFAVVQLDQCHVDIYQRPLSSFVKKIVRNFRPELLGCLVLSERDDGRYALVDGQTRAAAMTQLGMTEAPAIVFTGLTREAEARLFSSIQRERRAMTSGARFNSDVVAGDEFAVALNDIVEGLGFKIASGSESAPNVIRAVAALEWVLRGCSSSKKAELHPDVLAATLETIRGAWPRLPDTSKSGVTIRGIGLFIHRSEKIDYDRLATRLSKTTPSELGKRAEQLRESLAMSGHSTPGHFADVVEATYKRAR